MIKIQKIKELKPENNQKNNQNKIKLLEMMKKLEKICLRKNKKCKNIQMILLDKKIMIMLRKCKKKLIEKL